MRTAFSSLLPSLLRFMLGGAAGCSGEIADAGGADGSAATLDARAPARDGATFDWLGALDGPAAAPRDLTTSAPCQADPDKLGLTMRTVVGGSYLGYAPASYSAATPHALIVSLHGAGDTAASYFNLLWRDSSERQGFLVLSPEGSAAVGSGFTWNTSDANPILDEIDDFAACYAIDRKRILIHGFSAGGVIAYAIGLDQAQLFSGIAIASADLNTAEAIAGRRLLPAPWRIPVSHFHGMQDMNFPIQYAIAGKDRLIAAGHPFYWHPFNGGHITNPSDALTMYMDLASSVAP